MTSGERHRFVLALLALLGCCAAALYAATAFAAFGSDNAEIVRVAGGAEKAVPDGGSKFLVLTGFQPFNGIVRFRDDGSIDRSFGDRGRVGMPAADVAVAPDGKILVLSTSPARPGGEWDPVLTRLLPDGSLDRSFGHEGSRRLDLGGRFDSGTALLVDREGRILVAGTSGNVRVERGPSMVRIVLVRLRPGGAVDRSFGVDGRATVAARAEAGISDLAEGPGGSLVALSPQQMAVWKLHRDGSLDRGFGRNGSVSIFTLEREAGIGYFGPVGSVGVTGRGQVLLAGTLSYSVDKRLEYRAGAIRLRSDGSLDRGYGSHGVARGRVGDWMFAGSMLAQRDGRLVIGGQSQAPRGRNSDFAAVAFDAGGRLDPTFGRGGKLRVDLGHAWVIDGAIVARPHRRAILVGSAGEEEGHPAARHGMALARIDLFNGRR